jgi:hypothetical protein
MINIFCCNSRARYGSVVVLLALGAIAIPSSACLVSKIPFHSQKKKQNGLDIKYRSTIFYYYCSFTVSCSTHSRISRFSTSA